MDNNFNNKNGGSPVTPPKRNKIFTLLPYLLIPLVIILGVSYYADHQSKEKPEYYEIVALFDENKIDEYRLNMSNGALTYHLRG